MKISFVLASDFPSQGTLGLTWWRYSYNIMSPNVYSSGTTVALGLIFFHVGISFFKIVEE